MNSRSWTGKAAAALPAAAGSAGWFNLRSGGWGGLG